MRRRVSQRVLCMCSVGDHPARHQRSRDVADTLGGASKRAPCSPPRHPRRGPGCNRHRGVRRVPREVCGFGAGHAAGELPGERSRWKLRGQYAECQNAPSGSHPSIGATLCCARRLRLTSWTTGPLSPPRGRGLQQPRLSRLNSPCLLLVEMHRRYECDWFASGRLAVLHAASDGRCRRLRGLRCGDLLISSDGLRGKECMRKRTRHCRN